MKKEINVWVWAIVDKKGKMIIDDYSKIGRYFIYDKRKNAKYHHRPGVNKKINKVKITLIK